MNHSVNDGGAGSARSQRAAEPTTTRAPAPQTAATPAPTAAVLLIGNELLSGRTQDINLAFLARGLAARGIVLREARVISDTASVIVATLNHLRSRHDLVFTTGGIGPTHDDITADCVAEAFGVALPIHPEARARLEAFFAKRGIESNAQRLRMARVPAGASLIDNPVSAAPGFALENVYVMAGVPRIMQAMFEGVLPTLPQGPVIGSVSVTCNLGEGTLAGPLANLQQKFDDLEIGSYPRERSGGGWRVTLVGRGMDADRLAMLEVELVALIEACGGERIDPESGA